MPQLIGFILVVVLIYLLIVYVIVPLIVYVIIPSLLALTGLFVGAGVLYGFGYAIYNLCIACGRKISMRRNIVSNNSRECYFYWKGDWGKNLINVCSETMSLSCGASSDFYTQTTQPNINFFLRIVYFFAMISVFTGAVLFVPVLLICFSVVFLLAWTCNNLFALVFWGIERTRLLIRSIYAICPTCNKRVSYPVYHCKNCGAEHNNLAPSARFGIFHHTCSCGQKLPTLLLFGKGKLKSSCPHCKGKTGVSLDYSPHTIAFVGGKSVGKTFLRNVMCSILHQYASSQRWKFSIPPEDVNVVNAIKRELSMGQRPNETFLSAKSVALRVDLNRSGITERLYLYDAPGEAFTMEMHMQSFNYYEHLKTVIAVIDPLSLSSVRLRLPNVNFIPHISMVSPVSCLEKWLNSMEKIHSEGNLQKKLKNVKCCVVITKVDVPELNQIVNPQLSSNSTNEQCKKFLSDNGLPEIVSLIDNHFNKVNYFAVSCTGGTPDGSAFTPTGIERLWEWILK